MLQVEHTGERRGLVDNSLGLRSDDRVDDGLTVQRIHHYRLGADRSQRTGLLRRPGHCDDLVTVLDQHRDELTTDRTTRARDEDLHGCLLSVPFL